MPPYSRRDYRPLPEGCPEYRLPGAADLRLVADFDEHSLPTGQLCHHGYPVPREVPGVAEFIKYCYLANPSEIMGPVVFEAYGRLGPRTVEALAAVGTNLLLHPDLVGTDKGFHGARLAAQVIASLEAMFGGGGPGARVREVKAWAADILRSNQDFDNRAKLAGYLAERLGGCRCLDDEAEAARGEADVGMCSYCHKKSKDARLLDCGKCRLVKYCGRECQVAHWKHHKKLCRLARKGGPAVPRKQDHGTNR